MTSIETISVVVAAVGVLIAAVNQIYTSREANKQRQMQLFNEIYNNVLDREFRRDYENIMSDTKFTWENAEDWLAKYNVDDEPEDYTAFMHVWAVLGYICEVVNRGFVNLDLFDDIIQYPIIRFWERFRSLLHGFRIHLDDPLLSHDMEQVYNHIIQKRKQQLRQING